MERDYKLLLMVSVLVFTGLFITLVLADVLSTPNSEFNFLEDVTNEYNITIDKSMSVNFTWINITLPINFVFTAGTNASNSTHLPTFSNMTNGSGSVVLMWSNTTPGVLNSSDAAFNFAFNATSPNPGNFSIVIITLDNATQTNFTTVNVFINDTTYPEMVITNPGNNSNLSSDTFDFNYTFADSTSGFCWYTTSNLSGITNSSYVAIGTNWTGKTAYEGTNNFTLWCNDSANNLNSTVVFFTIDITAPSISHSCSPLVVSHGAKVTCSCSISDAITGIYSSSSTQFPSTQSYGIQTTVCSASDYVGNNASIGVSYTVIQGGGGTSSSGGGYTNTFVEDKEEFKDIGGVNKSLGEKNRVRIKINKQQHYIGVRELTETNATVEISSTPQEVIFGIGDENKFDVTEDGYYDLKVKLNSIGSEKADITILSIHEKIPDKGIIGETLKEELDVLKEEPWKIWAILGIILIIIGAGYYILIKKK